MTLTPSQYSQRPALFNVPSRKRKAQPEQALQRAVAEYLTVALGPNAWFSTLPLGQNVGARVGGILRAIGAKPGLPDMIITWNGRCLFLELKAPKGRVSDAQAECHRALFRSGCNVEIVRSLDSLTRALAEYGVPLRVTQTGVVG